MVLISALDAVIWLLFMVLKLVTGEYG